jgi:N-ethylmaleimide reductase
VNSNNLRHFSPSRVGPLELSHRVVLAPMTRRRADLDDCPSAMMAQYYRLRSSDGGLLITESAHPSYDSRGYIGAPGIYADEHVACWKKVTGAVHANGGRIFMQITHYGRPSHVDLSWGNAPIAPLGGPYETTVFTKNWARPRTLPSCTSRERMWTWACGSAQPNLPIAPTRATARTTRSRLAASLR